MPSFAITTPKYGAGEHVPKTLLSNAFISRDSRNVRERYGDYRAARGRLPALYDADYHPIAAPVLVHAITAVNQVARKITVAGNHADTINGAVVGGKVRINGSTGNDALYTLVSATNVEATTEIVVGEALASATADGNLFVGATRVLAYHRYIKESTGTEHLLLGTACHILLWNETNRRLSVKFTCGTPGSVLDWSFATFQDCVYATNNVDYVQKWDSHASIDNNFENLGGESGVQVTTAGAYLQKAKAVFASEGFLWFGCTTESGTYCPRRVRYSDANADAFNEDGEGDAGHKDLDDECGPVVGFASVQSYVFIAARDRMVRAWLTETDVPWYFVTERVRAGCLAPHTLVNDRDGRLYWLASDMTIRELESGSPVTSPHAAATLKKLNADAIGGACAVYYEDIDRLLFAVPTVESDTNDLLIEIDPASQSVVYHDIPVAAFGLYSRQSVYTWDTLPYDTYDEWGAAWLVWDAVANTVGFSLTIVADYDGYSYEFDQSDQDAGQTLSRTLVFETGLLEPQKHLAMFKRITQGIDLFFKRHMETEITVYAKTDGCRDWRLVGTSDLQGDGVEAEYVAIHLDADLRAKHFTFKIVADGYFEFVGMYVNDFVLDGLR